MRYHEKAKQKIAEFDGVRLGRDFENVLPSKLALVNDEILAFYLI